MATVVISVTIFLAGYPFRSCTALKISFIAITNDSGSGPLAVLVATNESNEEISFSSYEPQVKKYGKWSKPASISGTITVSAHAVGTFTLPVATNCEAWRASVFWIYDRPSEIEEIRDRVKANLSLNWLRVSRGHWPRYDSMLGGNPAYTAFSPEITNETAK